MGTNDILNGKQSGKTSAGFHVNNGFSVRFQPFCHRLLLLIDNKLTQQTSFADETSCPVYHTANPKSSHSLHCGSRFKHDLLVFGVIHNGLGNRVLGQLLQ
ncbi:hypothetical protein D3C75_834380 [compost metagenome]